MPSLHSATCLCCSGYSSESNTLTCQPATTATSYHDHLYGVVNARRTKGLAVLGITLRTPLAMVGLACLVDDIRLYLLRDVVLLW